ncbi:MAG: D-alanyl-D-alanine carboxypeptidase/D-alanyl-D-alanine endopeptidase [Terriglobales bacterium]
MSIRRAVLLPVLLILLSPFPARAQSKTAGHKTKAPQQQSLAARIDALLTDSEVARGFWGVDVVSLASGKTLYARNADKLFTPASSTKLFITATALATIGPDYRFRTTVETTGTVDRYGRLLGDLVLTGRGDPNLSGRTLPYRLRTERGLPPMHVLEQLADQLVSRRIKVIDGDLIADDSYFAFERYGEGWSHEDLDRGWGAPVSALALNDNVLFVSVLPADRAGEKAFASLEPYTDYYQLDNRVVTTPAGSGPRSVTIERPAGSREILLWGSIPLDDTGYNEALALEDPADFVGQIFRRLLERRGLAVYGRVRARHSDPAAPGTIRITATASAGGGAHEALPAAAGLNQPAVLAEYQSQPLFEDLRVINKVSQNLHAEILLRLLGRERSGAVFSEAAVVTGAPGPASSGAGAGIRSSGATAAVGAGVGTIGSGLEVVRGFLTQCGVPPGEAVLYDGSGLSRKNLVTPRALRTLLECASRQPWFERFRDTLPVAGVDGSLAARLKETFAEGNVTAKTGSLDHVNSLSGYATTRGGERVAFVIMANNHNLTRAQAEQTIDRIVEAIVETRRIPSKK